MGELVRSSLIDQIFDYIWDKIRTEEWKVGEKIPSETVLADTLGVSRMTLRAAIQRTNALGLTETRVGDGTYVLDFSMINYFRNIFKFNLLGADFEQLNEFRTAIHIGGIQLAFLRKDDLSKEIKKLEGIYKKMREVLMADGPDCIEEFLKYDVKFHECVCTMSGNQFLISLYKAIYSAYNEVTKINVERSVIANNSKDHVLKFHKDVLDAIKARDISKYVKAEVDSLVRGRDYGVPSI